eukprot:504083_1
MLILVVFLHFQNMATEGLQVETNILKQKVLHLTGICEGNKSEHEQFKAKCEVEYNNEREIHSCQINELQQQIRNQKQKLETIQQQLEQSQQLAERTAIEHNNTVQSMQQTIQNMKKEIKDRRLFMQIYEAGKIDEIKRLKNELIHERDKNWHLGKTLEQYTSFRSLSRTAFKIDDSKSTSSSKTRISSSTECSVDIKYANRNHDTSPVPRLSSSSRGYDPSAIDAIEVNSSCSDGSVRRSISERAPITPAHMEAIKTLKVLKPSVFETYRNARTTAKPSRKRQVVASKKPKAAAPRTPLSDTYVTNAEQILSVELLEVPMVNEVSDTDDTVNHSDTDDDEESAPGDDEDQYPETSFRTQKRDEAMVIHDQYIEPDIL